MQENQLYNFPATVIEVTDGDTMVFELDTAFGRRWKTKFRIYQESGFYFDTPETKLYKGVTEAHKQHGLQATARAIQLLLGKKVYVHTHKKGSFRYLAQVFLEDGRDYAEVMKSEGFQKKESYE